MDCLDVFWVVISPSPSHAFGLDVVGHDLGTLREGCAADCTLTLLLGDLSVQQFPHLSWRTDFAISPRVVRIFDALNTKLKSAFFPRLLTTAAEQRAVKGTILIPTEFHGIPPDWRSLAFAGYCPMRGSTSCSVIPRTVGRASAGTAHRRFCWGLRRPDRLQKAR